MSVGPAPRVSVIIPCYNQATLLGQAVDSCLAQTWESMEIIVVNDGSPDDTAAVAGRLAQEHAGRVVVLDQPNQGLAAARNNAVAASRGEYILPLDADDMFEPDMVRACAGLLDARPDLGIAYTLCRYFGDVESVPTWVVSWDPGLLCVKDILCYASMYRRELFDAIGGYRTDMEWGYEDWEFWVRAARHGWTGELIERPLFLHRLHGRTMYTGALERDAELKARMVAGNEACYDEATRRTARNILDGRLAPPPPGEFALVGAQGCT